MFLFLRAPELIADKNSNKKPKNLIFKCLVGFVEGLNGIKKAVPYWIQL